MTPGRVSKLEADMIRTSGYDVPMRVRFAQGERRMNQLPTHTPSASDQHESLRPIPLKAEFLVDAQTPGELDWEPREIGITTDEQVPSVSFHLADNITLEIHMRDLFAALAAATEDRR